MTESSNNFQAATYNYSLLLLLLKSVDCCNVTVPEIPHLLSLVLQSVFLFLHLVESLVVRVDDLLVLFNLLRHLLQTGGGGKINVCSNVAIVYYRDQSACRVDGLR